jgi:hypothetical protein
MRRDGLGPSRLQLAATLVLCVSLGATAGLGTRVQAQATVALDENWRGAYDVLVTQPGEDFGGAATDGLVDANFVATAGEGAISLEQLEAIRGFEAVEVAAPIGMVGMLREVANTPQLYITDNVETGESSLTDEPQLVRVTNELLRDTGVGSEVVWRSSGVAVLSRQEPGAGDLDVDDPAALQAPSMGWPGGFSPFWSNLAQQMQLGGLPAFGSTVIAVDPAAEMQLLGGQGGFLAPLSGLPESRVLGELPEDWVDDNVDQDRYLIQWSALSFGAFDPDEAQRTIVPLLINEAVVTSTRLRTELERSPEPPTEVPTSSTEVRVLEGAPFEPWETLERDVSDVAVPFSTPDLLVLWPGSQLPPGESGGSLSLPATALDPHLIGRPTYRVADDGEAGRPSFEVVPRELVRADGTELIDDPFADSSTVEGVDDWGRDPDVGLQRSYRPLIEVEGDGFDVTLAAPIGEFDSERLDLGMDAASYVPFGAYDPAVTRLLEIDGQPRLAPSLSGVDFITGPPGAITDLEGAAALRGEPPIDAIRVRVAGIGAYTDQAQKRVADLAAEIERLGLQATVVAGSSPQPVAITVPDRADGADLGLVGQDWTTLGAAVVVAAAMSELELLLLVLALTAATAGLIATSVLTGRHQRHAVAVLRTIGWTEAQLRSRLVRHQAPLVLAVFAATALLVQIGSRPELASFAALLGIVTALAAAVGAISSALTTARAPRPRRQAGVGLASPRALAARLMAATPSATGLQAVGLTLLGVATVATSAALRAARDAAGPTRLAGAVLDETAIATLTLAAAGLAAAAILLTIGQRATQRQRSFHWTTLRTLGIPEATLRRVLAWEGSLLTVAAAALTAATIALLPALDVTPTAALAATVALLAAATLATLTRATRSTQ